MLIYNKLPYPVLVSLLFISTLAAADLTEFVWSGAVTENTARIKARLHTTSTQVRAVVSTSSTLSNPVYSSLTSASSSTDRVADMPVSGLTADTQYYYSIEVDGVMDDRLGKFKTFNNTANSFKFVAAACGQTGSTHSVYTSILNEDPLFYLCTGDFFYSDIGVNDPDLFRQSYQAVMASTVQRTLYQNVPIVYVWDDHDFGPDNSNGGSASRPAARSVYQEYVPHYPLAEGSGDIPIYHTFSQGRVKFIVTDQRSEKDSPNITDDANKSTMGATQKAWLKQELMDGRDNYKLIVWVNSYPWIGNDSSDHWGGYTTERDEIAGYIKTNNIDNLCMIAGDAHMVAIDDGSNNIYPDGQPGFPVLQSAALDKNGSVKGGPYSEGTYPGGGQYSLIEITDTGGEEVQVNWTGKKSDGTILVTHSFTVGGTSTTTQNTVVPLNSEWKYLDNGTDLSATNWTDTSYDDNSWSTGTGNFGYGDTHTTTLSYGGNSSNKYITYYFRKQFNVSSAAAVTAASLTYSRDDGILLYLNGQEIERDNMPTGTIDASTLANSAIGGADETALNSATINTSLLVDGTNQLAAEVHQTSVTSSDLNFDAALTLTETSSNAYDQWLANYPSLTDTAKTADPDTDGFANLMEFALGSDPTQGDISNQFTIAYDSGTEELVITYNKAQDQAITYEIEATTSLNPTNWQTQTTTETTLSGNQTEVRLPYTPGSTTKYLRLKATEK